MLEDCDSPSQGVENPCFHQDDAYNSLLTVAIIRAYTREQY